MNKPPCKNCERRRAHPNCHADCQQYKDYVNSRTEYLEKRRKQSVIYEYITEKQRKRG